MSFNVVLLVLTTAAGIRTAFFFCIWTLAAAAALAIFYWGIYRFSPNYREHHYQLARSKAPIIQDMEEAEFVPAEEVFWKAFLVRMVIVAAVSIPYSLSFRLIFSALDLLVPILGRYEYYTTSHSCSHSYSHTLTHTRSHTIVTHTSIPRTHTLTFSHSHTLTYSHAHSHTHTLTFSHSFSHSHSLTLTYTHIHSHSILS